MSKKNPGKGQDVDDWMAVFRMDKKLFAKMQKKIRMTYNRNWPVPDPVERLKVVLRYLATGEGFNPKTMAGMFDATMEAIFAGIYKACEVSD